MAIEYTYILRRVDPENNFLGIIYRSDGQPDYFLNTRQTDFSVAAVDATVAAGATAARVFWETLAPPSDVVEGAEGTVEAVKVEYAQPPEHDPITENIVTSETFDPVTSTMVVEYTAVPATDDEVSQRRAVKQEQENAEPVALLKALALTTRKTLDPATLTDEELYKVANLYPVWSFPATYAVDDIVSYGGILYRCVQSHTSQADWGPEFVPALFTPYRNPSAAPEAWVQPTGAHDAYAIGDRVTHDNPNDASNIWIYESAIAANTTEPGRDSTFDRYWTPVSAV